MNIMPSADDITIRRATAEDHGAIVRNGDIYCGRDYLPAIFLQVVNDPEVYPIVAELKGRVVGFMMDHVIDGGMSVIRRAVRTFSGYRNMGIMHKMSKALNSLTEEKYPGLRCRYECTAKWEENSAIESLHLKGFTEIHVKRIIHTIYRAAGITDVGVKDELPAVTTLDYDDVKTLFTLDDQLEKLFPLKRIFNFFVGYRCLDSNIKHFLSDDKEVCVTIKTPYHTHHDTTKLSLLQEVDMVSFSFRHMGGAGLVYGIDIYAKEDYSVASLEAHIRRHLRVLKELDMSDWGILAVSIGKNVCEETLRSLLKHYGIGDRISIMDHWSAWFEKEI